MSQDFSTLPVADAIRQIITAADFHEASQIRNGVAYAAMQGQRPERDADACRQAYFDRWGQDLAQQRVGPIGPLYWTGD